MNENKLLAAVQQALLHIASVIELPLTVRLWDGRTVPLGPEPIGTVTIASAGVVASLLKKPSLENIIAHYALGHIAIAGGDLMTLGDAVRSRVKKADLRRLGKRTLLGLLWPFLMVKSQRASLQHGFDKDQAGSEHSNQHNKSYIQFHYDVSNEFYQLFLDPEMQYSCAYFRSEETTLEQAQLDKLEMICRKLRLKEGERMLDIGCGWGGLICYAALQYGVTAHGITLSEEQYAFAKAKIERLGLEGRVTVEIRDYLKLEGSYDKISSIGMFEHVGIANFPAYFRKIHSLLRERGLLLNHAIARRGKADSKRALRHLTPEKRMILKYIFPGSELAPISHSVNSMEAYGFELHDVEAWREHYALTARHWCRRLATNKERAVQLIGVERYNLWVAYLAGVSFGFTGGSILIFQSLGSKRAKAKGGSGLPLTREDLYREQAVRSL